MARGQVLTLPNQTATLIESSTHEELDSVAVLNPNDGVVYIKLNGPAGSSSSQWDWKLPSQSYGLFPGPWVSLGLYYLDQSGSGRTAELNVYDSSDKLYTPYIVAIGRAVQAAGTTMDISMGNQPQNPPASTVRLWADGNGDLHTLGPSGIDETVITNTSPLGGDLYGTISAGHIRLQGTSPIRVLYPNSTDSIAFGATGDNWLQINAGPNGLTLVNNANSVRMINFDNSSNMQVGGNATISGGNLYLSTAAYRIYAYGLDGGNNPLIGMGGLSVTPGPTYLAGLTVNGQTNFNGTAYGRDIYANRGDGTGVYYLAGGADKYLYFNGTGYVLGGAYPTSIPAQLTVGGPMTVSGGAVTLSGNQLYIGVAGLTSQTARGYAAITTNSGQGDLVLGGGASILYMHPNLTVGIEQASPYCRFFGNYPLAPTYYYAAGVNITWNGTYLNHSHSIQFNTSGNQILWSNGSYISGNAGYVQGSQAALKEDIVTIPDGKCLAAVLDRRMEVIGYHWPEDTRKSIGFTAESVQENMPNVVVVNEDGVATGYSPSELTAILWGAVRELARSQNVTTTITGTIEP